MTLDADPDSDGISQVCSYVQVQQPVLGYAAGTDFTVIGVLFYGGSVVGKSGNPGQTGEPGSAGAAGASTATSLVTTSPAFQVVPGRPASRDLPAARAAKRLRLAR